MRADTDLAQRKATAGAFPIVAGLAVLLPFVSSLLYVRSFGVDVFHADEWDFVALLREGARGTLGLADLLAPHNGHVYLVPWGLMLLLGRATGYDTVPLMYLVQACILATSLIVCLAYLKSVGRSALAGLLFVPVPLLLSSFRQHENMLWGNQISFALAQTFSVLALYLISAAQKEHPKRYLACAALCALVASCSSAPGLLAWPTGLLALLISPTGEETSRKIPTIAWAAAGAAVWIGYIVGYGTDYGTGDAFPSPAGGPGALAEYLLVLSGGALFWREGPALIAGASLLVVSVAALALCLARRRVGENAFWISLGAFSLLSVALVAAGRSGFADEAFARATLSRYAAFSIPGVVALYGLCAGLTLNARSRGGAVLLGVVLVSVVGSAVHAYPRGVEAGRATEDSRRQAARILVSHETEPPAAFTIFGHDPSRVQRYARFLDRHDYGAFAEATPQGARRERGPGLASRPPSQTLPRDLTRTINGAAGADGSLTRGPPRQRIRARRRSKTRRRSRSRSRRG